MRIASDYCDLSLVAEPNGELWLGYETPDHYCKSGPSSPSTVLEALYGHWYVHHFLGVVKATKGKKLRIFTVGEFASTGKLLDVGTSYSEISKHNLRVSKRSPKEIQLGLITTNGQLIGATAVAVDESFETIEQQNIFVFTSLLNGTPEDDLELLMAQARKMAHKAGLPLREIGTSPLSICSEHRQMMGAIRRLY